jgi:primase-polymerase (primpol)-like protein
MTAIDENEPLSTAMDQRLGQNNNQHNNTPSNPGIQGRGSTQSKEDVATNIKPTPLAVASGNIPEELKQYPQWVLWKFIYRNGKWTKPPFKINGKMASHTDPNTWASYDEIITAYNNTKDEFDGIGFVLTKDDPFTCIDIDHCLQDKDLLGYAQELVSEFNSYTERSPSGDGLHIWVKGELSDALKKPEIEMYDTRRYITVTGQPWGICDDE